MECGNPQVWSETGEFRQRLQCCKCTGIAQMDRVAGQKGPGCASGCPACADTRLTFISGLAGEFGFLQFGFYIQSRL